MPPRSPDLMPMNFFFWVVVKDKAYAMKPATLDNLKAATEQALQELDSV